MSLSWIKRAKSPLSVDDFIGAGEYSKAIDLMRKEFSQRYPSTSERQQYAEVLVRAGRGAEAVPVLLGVADEQERYGFPDKALEALRCAAAIDPEQSEVKERLESILSGPPEAPPAEEPHGSGSPLDGAATGPEEPGSAAEEVPGGVEAGTLAGPAVGEAPPVLDEAGPVLGEAGPVLGEAEPPLDEAGPDDELELVVVDAEDPETREPSPEPASATLDAGELEPILANAEDPENTKPSFVPEPAALEAEELEPIVADTEDSDPREPQEPAPAVLDAGELEPVEAEDLEDTRPNFVPEPAVLEAEDLEPLAGDLEDAEDAPPSHEPAPDLLLPEEDLEPDEVAELTAEAGPEIDARALVPESALEVDDLPPILTDEALEEALATDARALLSDGPTGDEPGSFSEEGRRDELLIVDARALLSDSPARDDPASLADDGRRDELLATDARALLSERPTRDEPDASVPSGNPDEELAADARGLLSEGHPDETHLFLSEDDLFGDAASLLANGPEPPSDENDDGLDTLVHALAHSRESDRPTLGSLFFADLPREELRGASEGLHRRTYSPGDTVIREGEPGHSVFLVASGSVRILVMGGHGQPFEIRRIDAGGFFGEVAALSGKPRSATVEAAAPCEMLEIDRRALDTLLAVRPAARPVLDDAWARRALSPEETAVRSLPPEAADPRQAAEALRAQFAGADWSPRVRLHLSGMMLEAGRTVDALATLAGVAEDLAQRGHAKGAIAILKKAARFRNRGSEETREDAAFRGQVESLLRETAELAARAAPPVEEVAEGAGEEQGDQLAG